MFIDKTIEMNLLTSIESLRKVRFITDQETFVSHLFYVKHIHHYEKHMLSLKHQREKLRNIVYTYEHLTAETAFKSDSDYTNNIFPAEYEAISFIRLVFASEEQIRMETPHAFLPPSELLLIVF